MTRFTITTLFVLLACGVSTAADEKSTPEVKKVTFDDDVKPIFRQHCASCHNQGEKKGGFALDTYTALIEGGGSGEVVYDDGDPSGSRLWQLINHDDTPVMPPNQDKLPAAQLAIIQAWIEGGILENSGSKAKAKKKNTLAFVAGSAGKPEGPAAMPESIPQRVPVVTERASAITAIAASPWAPLVAIAGQKQIALYHSETSELLGILPFAEGIAQSLRFSRDGSFLIAGGGEHSLQGIAAIYDVKTGERVATVGDELDVVFDADVNTSMSRVAMGGPQKMLRIYDATDGELLFDLKKHTDWIYTVAYSPDGVLIASGDRSAGLSLWEADTGRLYMDLNDHKGAINGVAWRDDSNVVASASDDGTVKVWDVNQGKAIKSINAHGGGVTDVAFDHQGRLVTAGKDKRVKLWDANGTLIREFQPVAEYVMQAAISHDGSRVIYGDWDGQVFSALSEKPEEKQSLAANPPPAAERAKVVEQQLVAMQQTLQPIKAELDAAMNAVAAAQKPIDELNAKIAAAKAEAEKSKVAADAATKKTAELDGQLPTLVNVSRDKHDAVIAVRVQANGDVAKLEAIAAAEQDLASHLTQLVNVRRERIATHNSVATHQQAAAAKTAEAAELEKMLPALQEALLKAQQAAEAMKQKHDGVATQLAAVQSKLDRLMAAVN
ncbi:Chromosome partition protein Smc [Novipirellula galeiformis]|uniref:Chromosome partition protein Smc n=1 Tax=Novipirellula galeiformis TaxID=2528004 RepID=A0A5C6CHI3_9BACT|nr:c-type cytochrome domain-containing protein [Novipirellula galeiformis]TWU23034.1 Chromosome partition protein Smc [Novipirellula galeiformis]